MHPKAAASPAALLASHLEGTGVVTASAARLHWRDLMAEMQRRRAPFLALWRRNKESLTAAWLLGASGSDQVPCAATTQWQD